MERRRLGRTGHESSVAVLGGAACWAATVEEAGDWLQLALDHGVNHLDIAPQYGAAESVVGPHLAAHRDELFIAGKTLRANPDGVTDQFDTTRRLLNAEVLDLYQAHAVTSLAELDRRSAALERILRAARRRPHPVRRDHRARHGGAPGPPRGTAPLRPRHRHVPRLSRPVGATRVPRAGRGAPRRLCRAGRRRHGDQGGGAAALGGRPTRWPTRWPAADATAGRWADSWYEPAGQRRRPRPRHPLRALDAGRPRLLHARGHRTAAAGAGLGRALPAAGATTSAVPPSRPWRRRS